MTNVQELLVSLSAAIAVIGSWYDCTTTQAAIESNKGKESNPAVRWIINKFGFPTLYIVKMFAIPCLLLALSQTEAWGGKLSLGWQTLPFIAWGVIAGLAGWSNHKSTGV